MSPSNAQLEQLDRELDENQRELIILPMDGPVTRIPPFTTVPTPTQAPRICTRTQPGLLDGAWGRTQAAYNGTVHEYVNTNAGVPSALGVYDLYNFAKFYRDIGGFGTKVKISTHNGRQYLVLTGHAGLRNKLKGTRYGIRNPQLVEMGIGKYGIRGTSISGFKLSCYVAVGIEVLEWVFNDEAVMSDLFAGIGVELVKAGIASAVGYAVAVIVAAWVGTVLLPVAAGAFIVFAVGYSLNTLDTDYGVKKSVKAGLRYGVENLHNLKLKFTEIRKVDLQKYTTKIGNGIASSATEHFLEETKKWALQKIQYEGIYPSGWPAPPRLPRLPGFNIPGL
ncbi:hypothetical protein [Pseudomonas sp. Marseille-Q5115]|uniref:hypothetical protein n=1 Tax=Pseudomonas sp. Marseille-Q5115 TaxID=2866593 RepID=UPI001CE47438|nr:hypothetical protein [Pseudomonas sp. Marseille-Q5115]